MLFRVVLALMLAFMQLGSIGPVTAKTVELPVYSDWRGNNCQFKSERPFFLIKDNYDLEKFWEKANSGDAMPGIDFDRYMLLVWAPGASLFDHRPVVVERLLCKEGKYIVLMDFKRKDTGGYWRRPFVATLLPLIRSGDIFIMGKQEKGGVQTDYKLLYTLWDMSVERTRPFEMVHLDPVASSPAFVEQTSTGKAPVTTATPQATQPTSAQVAVSAPTVAQPVKSTDTGIIDDDIFGSGSTGSSANVKTPEPAKVPAKAQPAPKMPTFEEDPLFGTEFDIVF